MLLTQTFEAHSVALAHAAPLGLGDTQMLPMQSLETHCAAFVHDEPLGLGDLQTPPSMHRPEAHSIAS